MSYLFGFAGRINRAKIWLFILIAIVTETVLTVAAGFAFQWPGFLGAIEAQSKLHPNTIDWFALPWPVIHTPAEWTVLAAIAVLLLALIWAGFAVAIKRLHDRNKSAWWLLLYWGVPSFVGLGLQCPALPAFLAVHTPIASLLVVIVLPLLVVLIDIWVFVDLYCLRGTKGENRFGPDPLAK